MRTWHYLLLLILFLPLLYFRDFTPNNELKYLSIADEAIRNGNIFTFTNHGLLYADKPPLYMWILISGKIIFGTHSMLFLGLFSLLPAFVILYIMDKWSRPFMEKRFRIPGQLMLMTSGLFLGSAIVLRMDMLMCMFIVLSLYTFYRIFTNNYRKRDKFLLPVYIFLALFSKGPIGLIIPIVTIFTFLIIKGRWKDFGKYLGGTQWLIIVLLSGLWLGGVYVENGKEYLHNLLIHQTIGRAVNSFQHKEPFYYYLKSVWYSLAPWSIFYISLLFTGLWKKLIQTDLEKLFLTTISITFIILSLFSSKLDIYLLPAFPFIAYLPMLLLPRIKKRIIYFSLIIPAIALLFAFPAFFILKDKITTEVTVLMYITAFLLSASAIVFFLFLYKKKLYTAINCLTGGILLSIFIGSFSIPSLNPEIGFRDMCKQTEQIARQENIQNFHFYKIRSAENMDVYLDREIKEVFPDKLEELYQKKSFVLFIKAKEYNKIIQQQNWLRAIPFRHTGKYNIMIFSKK